LAEQQIVSRFPATLADVARVPIVAAVPAYENGRVHVSVGAIFGRAHARCERNGATGRLTEFFEKEICSRPAVWSDTLHVERDMR
jgi:hypothetical protein